MNTDEHQIWNEKMAVKYDVDRFHDNSSFIVKFIETERIRKVSRNLNAEECDRILEVGCGSGRVLQQIKKGELFGIDISRHLLKKAKRRLGRKAKIRFGNAQKIPFRNNFFDKVICTEVLEHLLDPTKAIDEIRRVSKRNSLVILSVPNERLIHSAKQVANRFGMNFLLRNVAGKKNEWHIHEFDLQFLMKITRGKMRQVNVDCIPSSLLPLHYVVTFRVLK